jgi:cystathionine beta-lyase
MIMPVREPDKSHIEDIIAKLENGAVGVAFGSGLAAIDAVIKLLKTGDEILAVDDIYGGAFVSSPISMKNLASR